MGGSCEVNTMDMQRGAQVDVWTIAGCCWKVDVLGFTTRVHYKGRLVGFSTGIQISVVNEYICTSIGPVRNNGRAYMIYSTMA